MDYEIKYKSGKTNVVADALSRHTSDGLNSLITTTTTPELVEEIRKSWELPNGYCKLLVQLKVGKGCKHFSFE